MIRFRCVSCNKTYSVDPKHVGKKAKCKSCGNVNVIPAASVPAPKPAGIVQTVIVPSPPKLNPQPTKITIANAPAKPASVNPQPPVNQALKNMSTGAYVLLGLFCCCCGCPMILGNLNSGSSSSSSDYTPSYSSSYDNDDDDDDYAAKRRLNEKIQSLSDDDAVAVFVGVYRGSSYSKKQELYDGVVSRANAGDSFYKSVLARISPP